MLIDALCDTRSYFILTLLREGIAQCERLTKLWWQMDQVHLQIAISPFSSTLTVEIDARIARLYYFSLYTPNIWLLKRLGNIQFDIMIFPF